MEVLEIKDNTDGSANMVLELSEEEIEVLLNLAINQLLKEYIERVKNES